MCEPAHRQFYTFSTSKYNSEEEDSYISNSLENNDKEELFDYVNTNVIGSKAVFSSPYGPRKVTYCDYTASGRSLYFIENYILEQVLPLYGSTHTTTTVTSLQTTLFRHEARDIIRNAVRASEHDRIIFTGSGATGAFNKLIHGLELDDNIVVFVDFSAHHSSLLPWRECGGTVVRIRETKDGSIDKCHLEINLKRYKEARIIGCFSLASNITGVINDDVTITKLLHQYGAMAIWDYATAAPYVDIMMNPVLVDDPEGLASKDAIFFSLHKFIGGVQTPGVLVAKEKLFKNEVPSESGGGTVFFVSRESHRYLKDIEEREEGGTPPIVETIRGGMVMQLKMNLAPSAIMQRCHLISKRLSDMVSTTNELISLGNILAIPRLPILSFLVKHSESGKYLHYNYLSAILNDLFGIQSRGGCACAGPYAQDVLGIDENLAQKYEEILIENPSLDRSHLRRKEEHNNLEILRPGFCRINIPYTANEDQISFILEAIKKVSINGWKLLPQYIFNPETGEWKHHTNLVFKQRQWLQNISYNKGRFSTNLKVTPDHASNYEEILQESEQIFQEAQKVSLRMIIPDESMLFNGEINSLCWFMMPSEAKNFLIGKSTIKNLTSVIFVPPSYPLNDVILNSRPDYLWKSKKINRNSKFTFQQNSEHRENICEKPAVKLIIQDYIEERTSKKSKITESFTCDLKKCELIKCTNNDLLKDSNKISIFNKGPRWIPPTKIIFNPTLEAIREFNMIKSDDKVLVCLSGGKDSLSLLHTLHQYQFYSRANGINFLLGAVTVDPQTSSYDPRPLIPYLAALNVPYFFEQQGIMKQAMEIEDLNSICSFCSRMKRGRIYAAARREGYNVLALGQHLDDLAESFLMSIFHNGRLRTMKASYSVKEGDLRVIRPFVYVREKDLRYFAESNKLPIIPENCPACFEIPKERHRVKQLLAQQEVLFPRLFWSLKTAILPLISIRKTGLENILFGKRLSALSDSDFMDKRPLPLSDCDENDEIGEKLLINKKM